ncbi:MAG: carboxypeptidase-like regulatory domain-containing protein [Bacteroidota bacterium]
MSRIKIWSFLIGLLSASAYSQMVDLNGKVEAPSEVSGIHIINKTSRRFTVTNDKGEFTIPAKLNDTISFSGIQYQAEEVVIDQTLYETKSITITLKDNINELDEVVVGKILTDNLLSDIENSDAKADLNFYDVGIPGYTGRRKTQSERRLYEAQTGAGILPLNPLLNWISGRTKKLKNRIKRERIDKAMTSTAESSSEVLFEIDDLDEIKRNEFFFFVADDPKFVEVYRLKSDLQMLEFLNEKLKAFKIQASED